MMRLVISSLLLVGCVSSTPVSTRHSVLELHEAADAAHHCMGEEPTDEARATFLRACADDNLARARALLPGVIAAKSIDDRSVAVFRLFLEEPVSSDERAALCARVPSTDFMASLVDDEVRATCGR